MSDLDKVLGDTAGFVNALVGALKAEYPSIDGRHAFSVWCGSSLQLSCTRCVLSIGTLPCPNRCVWRAVVSAAITFQCIDHTPSASGDLPSTPTAFAPTFQNVSHAAANKRTH